MSPPSYSDVHIYLWDYPLNSQHDFTQPPRERRRQQFKQINWEKMSKVNYFYSSTSVKKSPAILLIPRRVIIKQDLKQKLSTEPENMACTWFGEICSGALNNSRNKFHQTTYKG